MNPNTYQNVVTPTPQFIFSGIPGCHKCGGSGYKFSKKKNKSKPCKKCMIAKNYCAYCNNTGLKIKNGVSKTCKCRKENCCIY